MSSVREALQFNQLENSSRPLLYRQREGDALAGIVVQRHPVHFVHGES